MGVRPRAACHAGAKCPLVALSLPRRRVFMVYPDSRLPLHSAVQHSEAFLYELGG